MIPTSNQSAALSLDTNLSYDFSGSHIPDIVDSFLLDSPDIHFSDKNK